MGGSNMRQNKGHLNRDTLSLNLEIENWAKWESKVGWVGNRRTLEIILSFYYSK